VSGELHGSIKYRGGISMAKEKDTFESVQKDFKALKQLIKSGLISYTAYISKKRIVKARMREFQGAI